MPKLVLYQQKYINCHYVHCSAAAAFISLVSINHQTSMPWPARTLNVRSFVWFNLWNDWPNSLELIGDWLFSNASAAYGNDLILSNLHTHFDAYATDDFAKVVVNPIKNCSYCAISPLPQYLPLFTIILLWQIKILLYCTFRLQN